MNMYGIDIMVKEHDNIKRMLQVIRKMNLQLVKTREICYQDFEQVLDFVKSYADNHHHGKEEKILFDCMVKELGTKGKNLITHGMMVEHDYGRLYMKQLREALERLKNGDEESILDIVANSIGYANLLQRHIIKEDELVYQYGEKALPQAVLDEVNRKTEEFETAAQNSGVQKHYIDMLEALENKYSG